MEMPLKQLLGIDQFRSIGIRAGSEYLGRIITRVAFIDCPEGIHDLCGGELLLSSGYIISNSPEMADCLIRQCAIKGIGALGFAENFFNTEDWSFVYKLSLELHLPILSIPRSVSFNYLSAFISENYVSRTRHIVRKKLEVVIELNEALRNEGFPGVIKSFYNWTGRQVLMRSATDEFKYAYPNEHLDFPDLSLQIPFSEHAALFELEIQPDQCVLCGRLRRDSEEAGFICITQGVTAFTRDDHELLLSVISICENELKINRDLLTLQYEQTHRVVVDIIKERLDENTAKILSRNLGHILPERYVVLFSEIKSGSTQQSNGYLNKRFSSLGALCTMYEPERFLALCPPHLTQNDLERVFSEITNQFPEFHHTTVVCFNVDFGNIPAAFNHTRRAMKAVNILQPQRNFFSTEDLGIYSLLDTDYDSLLIRRYYERYIEPLASLPDSNLLQTLHALSRNCFNYSKTAKEMYLHNNTIRYRTSVIEHLLNVNVNNAEDRLELEIALRIDILYSQREL